MVRTFNIKEYAQNSDDLKKDNGDDDSGDDDENHSLLCYSI